VIRSTSMHLNTKSKQGHTLTTRCIWNLQTSSFTQHGGP